LRINGICIPVTSLLPDKRMQVLGTDSVVVRPVSEHEHETCFACFACFAHQETDQSGIPSGALRPLTFHAAASAAEKHGPVGTSAVGGIVQEGRNLEDDGGDNEEDCEDMTAAHCSHAQLQESEAEPAEAVAQASAKTQRRQKVCSELVRSGAAFRKLRSTGSREELEAGADCWNRKAEKGRKGAAAATWR
jgi:hypothetical protein